MMCNINQRTKGLKLVPVQKQTSPDSPKESNLLMCNLSKVEVERALVDAEQESEVAALQQEKEALESLHSKIAELETKSKQEKEKVFNNLCLIIKLLCYVREIHFLKMNYGQHRDPDPT